MNNKNIYFHVGLPKTGSTFLQKNFFPKLKNIKYINTNKYRRCINIIQKTNYNNYLISREFDRELEYEIKKITAAFPETKIIIVFREHKKWISSQFKKYSKNGFHYSFENFFNENNTGFWKDEDMIYKKKIEIIKKHSKHKPLVLNFEELKSNPYSYLTKISNYTKSKFKKSSISLNIVHKSYSEKQLIFLKGFCRIFKNKQPTYYSNDRLKQWLFFRPWWLLFHLVMYLAYFIPKKFIVKKPLIDKKYLNKTMNKYKKDWDYILKYT